MAARRRPVLAEFVDKFGETQVIHRKGNNGALAIRRSHSTVALAMQKSVGKLVGARVREERLKAAITLEQLAERSGLKGGKQAIYQIEQAMNTGVRLGTLYAIAAALNVSPFSLLPPVTVVLETTGVKMLENARLAM